MLLTYVDLQIIFWRVASTNFSVSDTRLLKRELLFDIAENVAFVLFTWSTKSGGTMTGQASRFGNVSVVSAAWLKG
jgi:hypothetical protein